MHWLIYLNQSINHLIDSSIGILRAKQKQQMSQRKQQNHLWRHWFSLHDQRGKRERETERQRQREIERDRERERQRQRQTERETARDRVMMLLMMIMIRVIFFICCYEGREISPSVQRQQIIRFLPLLLSAKSPTENKNSSAAETTTTTMTKKLSTPRWEKMFKTRAKTVINVTTQWHPYNINAAYRRKLVTH